MIDLKIIPDGKVFERLCADLLTSRGFRIEREQSVDTTGFDIEALHEYRAHDKAMKPVTIRWYIQCKHYVRSSTNLNREDLAKIINDFVATRAQNDALLVITSSDYTEPAMRLMEEFNKKTAGPGIELWNGRAIISYLDSKPELARRYGLIANTASLNRPVLQLSTQPVQPILIVSDQSALAHDLCSLLKEAGLTVNFLPFWTYHDKLRLNAFLEANRDEFFPLVAVFLGDTFERGLSLPLEQFLVRNCGRGGGLLLFPFIAWSIAQGSHHWLGNVVPVRLAAGKSTGLSARIRSLATVFGDIFDGPSELTFEEDEYREYDLADAQGDISAGASGRFGFSHTFEHLEVHEDAQSVWSDTKDNPFLVRASLTKAGSHI